MMPSSGRHAPPPTAEAEALEDALERLEATIRMLTKERNALQEKRDALTIRAAEAEAREAR